MTASAQHLVLVSGGLDSATALAATVRDGHPVRGMFFDYGQAPARSEEEAASRVCGALGVSLLRATLPALEADADGMYFGRNAAFVLLGAGLVRERPLVVTLGLQLGPPWYDATGGFVVDLQRVLDGYGAGTVRVAAPLEGMNKAAVLLLAQQLGVPVGETYSCQRRSAPPCGACPSCLDREVLGV